MNLHWPDFDSVSLHPSLSLTYQKLKKWLNRFFVSHNESIFNDLLMMQVLAKKKFLDHRIPSHLFRLVLSIYHTQRKLMHLTMLQPHVRHVIVRWIPTELLFPFSSKPVLGCLIGFNVLDKYELFDEENMVVALQKYFPKLEWVNESYYQHASQGDNLKIFYFEVKKNNSTPFSLSEQKILKNNIEEKIKNSIQQLSPSVLSDINMGELYKNLLILSKEIRSIYDPPQVYITLDQHTGKEIIFNLILVQISPFQRLPLKERLTECQVLSERMVPIRSLEDHPIVAYIFRLSLPRTHSFLRSDGSLDFYAARQKITSLLTAAIGEFHDYNGGLLVKQQELLFSFKNSLMENSHESELVEIFFYALVPIEKQALLHPKILAKLFHYFSEERREKITQDFSLKIHNQEEHTFLTVHSLNASISPLILSVLENQSSKIKDWAYNFIEINGEFFFNAVFLHQTLDQLQPLIQSLEESLIQWREKKKKQQILRIALEDSLLPLDPRIGGEGYSNSVTKILFEGLTRFNQEGHVENAVADFIEISPDLKEYTFHLRHSLWNDGTLVSAHDFAYAWKKVLAPDFKTHFAHLFYLIKNAKEMKEKKVAPSEVGIYAIDDTTLRVELLHPAPYFLQLIAHPLFSPIHRFKDQKFPEWPYQAEKNYPCNGPFQLQVNQPSQGYQLIKNPFYWDATHITLDQIILTKMEPVQAVQAFQRNEVDWLGYPFGPWNPTYKTEKEAQQVSFPKGLVSWFVFNTNVLPFNNIKLRRAFALAIDRKALIQGASLPLDPVYSLFPSSKENEEELDFPELHIEEARQLLQEALHEQKLTLKNFQISISFCRLGIFEHVAQGLKKQIESHLGLKCHLNHSPWNSHFKKLTEGDFQVGLINWTSWFNDPIYTLKSFKNPKEGVNISKWGNSHFQELIDLSDQALNPFQRSVYLREATELLSKEIPVIPLFGQPYQAVTRKELSIQTTQNFSSFNISKIYYNRTV